MPSSRYNSSKPLPVFLPSGRGPLGSSKGSTDFKETRVALIAPARSTATLRLATQLLLADEGERSTELFVLDNRGLRDLANFVKGPIRQFDAAVTDRQPTVGIVHHGDPLADRRFGLVGRFHDEEDFVVLQGQRL
jgi:hypothetical protein